MIGFAPKPVAGRQEKTTEDPSPTFAVQTETLPKKGNQEVRGEGTVPKG